MGVGGNVVIVGERRLSSNLLKREDGGKVVVDEQAEYATVAERNAKVAHLWGFVTHGKRMEFNRAA